MFELTAFYAGRKSPARAGRAQARIRAGPDWDKAYDYFDNAWNALVLPRFRYAMEVGPIDWTKIPDLQPVASTMKVTFSRP